MAYDEARSDLAARLRRSRDLNDRVVDAIEAVPRHEFVPESRREAAYRDTPLPIGHDQTISAPHMVAVMCDLLEVDRGDRVLEVGTGCGYHAAVTAELVGPGNVYSVEYVPDLAASARERLERLGYDVNVRQGDGSDGWPENAPYDAAYLTAAPKAVPDAVVEQVRPGGVVVAPVGSWSQHLVRLRKRDDGSFDREEHGRVRFVRMQGDG